MSFAITSIVITVITSAVTAYGQHEQGVSQKKWQDYNAQIQQKQANEVLAQSKREAEQKRAQGETLLARQHVLYAKAGLDLSGTPTEVMLGTAEDIEGDAQMIMHRGQMGYEQGMEQSDLSKAQGTMAENLGNAEAGGSLLSGLGKAAGTYSKNYQPGGNSTVSDDSIRSAFRSFE